MIIDFHVHGKIKKSFPFDEDRFLLTINEAKENGLDSLAITEHFNSANFLEGYSFLKSNYTCIDDYYDVDGFKVFYGMEVKTKQELEFLVIGNPELVLELRESIINNLNNEKYLDINDLFKLDISDELLIILAHPYRNHIEFPELETNIIDKLDAIELNSKCIYKSGLQEMKEKVTKLSEKLKLPITGGSDTHHFIQVSTAKNIFSKNCNTIREIKEEIKKRNYKIEFSSDLKVRVKSAKIIKKLICYR